MQLYNMYLRKKVVYLPAVAKVLTGGHQEIEPVTVADVFDTEALRQAVKTTFARGNPLLEKYSYSEHKEVAVLKCVGIKSYSAFVRQSEAWNVIFIDDCYEIHGLRRRMDRGWEPDDEKKVILPVRSTENDLIERVVQILQDAASKDKSPD